MCGPRTHSSGHPNLMGYQKNADFPVSSTTSTKTNAKPRGNKHLNANITVHIHFATATAFAHIPTLLSHTLPPSDHCRYQSVWSTTAQFAWLASSAPARSTGTQEQSRWAPPWDQPGLAHRPPSRDLSGCFYLRCRSLTPCTSRQQSCPAQRTSYHLRLPTPCG